MPRYSKIMENLLASFAVDISVIMPELMSVGHFPHVVKNGNTVILRRFPVVAPWHTYKNTKMKSQTLSEHTL